MRFLKGTKEQMLYIRDFDANVFGFPYGETLRKWNVILRNDQYLYPYDIDFEIWITDNNSNELNSLDIIEAEPLLEIDRMVLE
jgi:hypothetical protein